MAEALYRKYRPQVFEDVVGQEPIERTLKNAIAQDKVSHAYLFCGPRGTGKTTTARLLAKALLCEKGPTPDPDGSCEDCNLIAEGAHPDVYELDAASRTGVENVREEIISRVQFVPTRGRYKVYIIDEVHMLSTAAFNALLKTLEEPPGHVVFVLCTTDPQKVPETIHSRCQRFDFRRIAPETMVSRLGAICMAEEVEFEGEALDLIAQRAEGGLRNALTSLEQIIAYEGGKVTLKGAEYLLGAIDSNDMAEIMGHVGRRDIANCFRWTADYVETGADLAQFVRDMSEHVRNLYVMALVGDDAEIEVSETTRHQLAGELQWFGPDRASRLLGVLGDLSAELKTSSNPRLSFEIALTRMVRPDSDLTLEALAERVEALESGYSAVAHVVGDAQAVHGAPSPVGVAETARNTAAAGLPTSVPVEAPAPDGGLQGDERAGFHRESVQPHGGAPSSAPSTADAVSDAAAARNAHAERAAFAAQDPAAMPHSEPNAQQAADGAGSEAASVQAQSPSAGKAASDTLGNPAALQRIWQAALTMVKKEKQAHGVLFMGAKARYDAAAGVVKVVFPAENGFAFNAVQKRDVQEVLARALQKAAGFDVPYVYEQAGSVAAQPQPQPQAQVRQTADVARRQPASIGHADVQAAPEPASDASAASDGQALPAGGNATGARDDMLTAGGAASPKPESAPQTHEPAPYEDVPYDQVPYEDMAYDPVPYEEFEQSSSSPNRAVVAQPMPNRPMSEKPVQAREVSGQPTSADHYPDVSTAPSPADGAREDPADIEAMLQAGFGGNVVFSEIDE